MPLGSSRPSTYPSSIGNRWPPRRPDGRGFRRGPGRRGPGRDPGVTAGPRIPGRCPASTPRRTPPPRGSHGRRPDPRGVGCPRLLPGRKASSGAGRLGRRSVKWRRKKRDFSLAIRRTWVILWCPALILRPFLHAHPPGLRVPGDPGLIGAAAFTAERRAAGTSPRAWTLLGSLTNQEDVAGSWFPCPWCAEALRLRRGVRGHGGVVPGASSFPSAPGEARYADPSGTGRCFGPASDHATAPPRIDRAKGLSRHSPRPSPEPPHRPTALALIPLLVRAAASGPARSVEGLSSGSIARSRWTTGARRPRLSVGCSAGGDSLASSPAQGRPETSPAVAPGRSSARQRGRRSGYARSTSRNRCAGAFPFRPQGASAS
jgi:hypothetical protein